jgi:hypothetical protein
MSFFSTSSTSSGTKPSFFHSSTHGTNERTEQIFTNTTAEDTKHINDNENKKSGN